MRMPRSSSFSVRDILDLPQLKNNSNSSVTSDNNTSNTSGIEAASPTHISTIQQTEINPHRFHGKFNRPRDLYIISRPLTLTHKLTGPNPCSLYHLLFPLRGDAKNAENLCLDGVGEQG